MNIGFIVLLCILGSAFLLVSLENRAVKNIKKEAIRKNFVVKEIREPEEGDGKNPFGAFDIAVGCSSNIFMVGGERTYNRIVTVENNGKIEKFWVRTITTFFITTEIDWHKIS